VVTKASLTVHTYIIFNIVIIDISFVVTNQFSRPSIRAQPSRVKTTQIYTKLVCSDGVSAGLLHQHNLIHPDSCLRDTSYITRKEKITDSDIRTLFKVFMIVV
jgi:hypothetical protein